ncbi:MAG: hypothetical protein LBD94_00605 [Rickettsiales bacterium]|jgi:hypothetical protein|nr:hypothetical protein [Rickettsiales bacterium]
MARKSVLVWNGKADALYREARRQIASRMGIAPRTVKELDFSEFFDGNENAVAYFPVFQETIGWWGPLLGTNAKIQSKMIVSPECQIYEIGLDVPVASRKLFAAEVSPGSVFFRKVRETAATIKDMIATDSGTILTLLAGNSEDKIRRCVKTSGGEYFGYLGGY